MSNSIEFFEEKFELTDKQKKQYSDYARLIAEYNKVMNLTGIDDEFNVYLKHFYDSLLIAEDLPDSGAKIGDIGSGAGFPGVVLAIKFPGNQFYLIEPMQKRAKFLQLVVEQLGLENVEIVNDRAEDLDGEQYDVVTARAVAALNVLLELGMPLLKVGGKFIALKGSKGDEELRDSKNALTIMNGEVVEIHDEVLPYEESARKNIIIRKKSSISPKYPRYFGQIKKNPL